MNNWSSRVDIWPARTRSHYILIAYSEFDHLSKNFCSVSQYDFQNMQPISFMSLSNSKGISVASIKDLTTIIQVTWSWKLRCLFLRKGCNCKISIPYWKYVNLYVICSLSQVRFLHPAKVPWTRSITMIARIDISSTDSVAVVEITLWKISEPKSNLDNKLHFEFYKLIFIPRKWTIQSI